VSSLAVQVLATLPGGTGGAVGVPTAQSAAGVPTTLQAQFLVFLQAQHRLQTLASAEVLGTVGFAVSVGVVTFFAPCAYPLLPGYVGYYLGQEHATVRGAALRGAAAAGGALVTLGAVAAVILTAGQAVVSRIVHLEPIVGLGLVGLGVLTLSGRAPEVRVLLPERSASVSGFAVFGAVYALAAAGCVIPAVLAVVTAALALPPAGTAVAFGGYALAVAAPLAVVTLLAAAGSDLLRRAGGHVGTIQQLAGVIMIVAGVWQIVRSALFLGWV
jgi:cytochrome c-type biogenesis protein